MAKRSGVKIRTKLYNRFRGVDFTTDPSLVDDTRSPYAPNMIADKGGMPEKRPGYRVVEEFDDEIYGLYNAEFSDVKHLLAHTGTKLYRWYEDDTEAVLLYSSMPETKSMAVYMDGKLWIFTGTKLLVYDGTNVVTAESTAYVPLVVISSPPAGGGTTYEGINYLTNAMRVGFLADGTSTEYQLPKKPLVSVDSVKVDDTTKTEGTDYTVDLTNGKVTFTTAPTAPASGAADNVEIQFKYNMEGYADRINKCTTAIVWGMGGAADRIVATGNPDFKNQDYICEYKKGNYWSDKQYSIVGTSETSIIGYRRIGETLAVIKEDNGQDSTIFIRSGSLNTDGDTEFTIKPTISGTGAVSRFGFGNIDNEQLFLTGNGVYTLTTNALTAEKIVQNRSYRVDPKLKEEDLASAITASFGKTFMIFVDGVVYGLDGNQQKTYYKNANTYANEYSYECFYWTNIPATCVNKLTDNGEEFLYFGTADGNVCKFNTDIDSMFKYSDDGEPIEAIWATKADDDGDPMVLKTLLKKGNAVTLKPYARSSAKVLIRTDKDVAGWQANQGTMDIFSWEDIDFSRITFNSNEAPMEIPINRKVKNYKRLQFLIKNDVLNEGFGVYGVVKHFVRGNFAKR